jgi:hypothetical protein
MSIQTVKDKIDNWLTPRWSWLVQKQEDYFATNGRYWQGLWSHSGDITQTDALDGDTVADALDDSPHDQTHTWRDALGNALDGVPFPARLRVDVYEGPLGHGWTAYLEVLYNGTRYVRSKGVGPHSVTQGWHIREIS